MTDAQRAILEHVDTIDDAIVERAGMRKIRTNFSGSEVAFFPVGCGFLGARLPHGGIMIVGSEFGTEKNVDDVLRAGSERLSDPTWRPLLDRLERAGIAREECWFTNFALCARAGAGSNSNKVSPWKSNRQFITSFARIFVEQVEAQRPRGLIVLGAPAAEAMAMVAPEAFSHWSEPTVERRDANDGAFIMDAVIGTMTIPRAISIVHPSKGRLNEHRRRFRDLEGATAEHALMELIAQREEP